MVCIKRCKLPGTKYMIGVGDNVIVDKYRDNISDKYRDNISWIGIIEEEKGSIPMYRMLTGTIEENFMTLTDWRNQQIDKILNED
jgi:hypothetical protein